jgi:hypothetical protein
MKEFIQAVTELAGDKSFLGEVKAAFYGSMIKPLKKSIDPRFHDQYDFKSIASVDDARAMLVKAKNEDHLVRES